MIIASRSRAAASCARSSASSARDLEVAASLPTTSAAISITIRAATSRDSAIVSW
jgi:hypothetical protein